MENKGNTTKKMKLYSFYLSDETWAKMLILQNKLCRHSRSDVGRYAILKLINEMEAEH